MLVRTEIKKDTFPLTISFSSYTSVQDFINWYREHEQEVEQDLYKKGAILIEGLEIDSIEKFGKIAGAMAEEFTDYIDVSYQRRKLSANVYISTEYDSSFPIKMHNELSYANCWPSRLIFACTIPAISGGQTPLADSREVLKALDAGIVEEFCRKKIRYVRNFHNGQGLGPSWQETFKTDNPSQVEEYCRREEMNYIWKKDGSLKLEAIRPPVRKHPVTGEEVWFSVAELYHPSHFDKEYYETLLSLADGNEEDLPLYSSYGDGTKIADETIQELIKTIESKMKIRSWNPGDLVLVDNMLASHGRMPYKGSRQVLVYLCK